MTSVTVTSPGATAGLQTSSSGLPDAGTASVPMVELHPSVLSRPEGEKEDPVGLRFVPDRMMTGG